MRSRGFTLIEMLVVMAALGLLLSIAAPRYVEHIQRGREVVLRQDLAGLREAIDKFFGDRGRYPKDLAELVTENYVRRVPVDPITDRSDTWLIVHPRGLSEGLFDVRSGAAGVGSDGSLYASW